MSAPVINGARVDALEGAMQRHSKADEQAVLGAMMMAVPESPVPAEIREMLRPPDAIRGVGEHHFTANSHGLLWKTIVALMDRGEPFNALAVNAEVSPEKMQRMGGVGYLHTCVEACLSIAQGTQYARNVANATLLRQLGEAAAAQAQQALSSSLNDADEVYDRVRVTLDRIAPPARRSNMVAWEIAGPEALDEMDRLQELAAQSEEDRDAVFSTGWPDVDRMLGPIAPGSLIVIAARPGVGKALALDTPLPTPTGWTTMGEVRIGDRLLGADGRPVRVIDATEVLHGRPCYEVMFSDGSTIVADALHQWYTETRADRRVGDRGTVKTTEEIAATMRVGGAEQRLNHSVPVAQSVRLPEADLPVAPYTLGAWLGDGTSRAAQITTADPELLTYIEDEGYEVRSLQHPMQYAISLPSAPGSKLDPRSCVVCDAGFQPSTHSAKTCGKKVCVYTSRHIPGGDQEPTCARCDRPLDRRHGNVQCGSCRLAHGSLVGRLREVGVYANKHIPTTYLRASEAQRRALLAGLLDTDGTVAPHGVANFTVTSRRLAYDVRELVLSLGYRCTISTKRVRGRTEASSTAYQVNFSTADEVFRLERKKLAHKERARTKDRKRTGVRYIAAVRRIDSVPVRCVSIDNTDHLYLAGETMIPTHNSVASRNVVQHLAMRRGLPAIFFSLEMSRLEISVAMMAAGARIHRNAIKNGTMSDDEWADAAKYLGATSAAPLELDDTPAINQAYMDRALGAVTRKYGRPPAAYVIDYLQLASEKGYGSRQEEVGAMSRGHKLLAKRRETVAIAVSQLNRNVEGRADKRPQLSDLRESGSIEQDADVVILLDRPDYQDEESPRAGEVDLIIAKNRNGPTGTVTLAAQLHFSRFVSMAIQN